MREDRAKNGVFRVLRTAGGFGLLVAAFLANIGEGVSRFMIASGGGNMLDSAIARDADSMVSHFLRVVLFVAAIAVCIVAKDSLLGSYVERGVARLRRATVAALGSAKMSWLESRHTGELSARATADLNALAGSLRPVLIWGISQITIQLITVLYMLTVDWLLTVIIFAIVPVTTLLQWIMSKPIRKYRQANQSAIGALSSVIYDCFGSFETVKSLSLEEELLKRFEKTQAKQLDAALSETRALSLLTPLAQIGRWFPQFILVLAGGMFVISGRLTVGQIIMFLALSSSALSVIGNIANLFSAIRQLGANAERVAELWDTEREREGGQAVGTDTNEAIQFDDVRFQYRRDIENARVLDHISFQSRRGTFVALVGESGCGKSTALKLAAALYTPDGGTVRLFGRDVGHWNLEALRGRIAYVAQDTYLFPGSLLENIRAGRESASPEWVGECLRLARLDDFAAALPEGVDTPVGERGAYLSGGQRQRISIARALCKEAELLMLDEATSALDGITEAQVLDGILNMENRPTLLMVTHRLSNVKNANHIVVFKEGRLYEQGTHEELLLKQGEYARLLAKQEEEEAV